MLFFLYGIKEKQSIAQHRKMFCQHEHASLAAQHEVSPGRHLRGNTNTKMGGAYAGQ